jgi:putative peptidoglycan lipid II flippase
MVVLSQILFPILILLGVTGLVVGILNSYDRFGALAISPLFWNLTIILTLVLLVPSFSGNDRIYAYAIGILAGTVVQLAIPAWDLRHTPMRFTRHIGRPWRDPAVRRVLLLMLPVAASLGLVNFNLVINSFFGSLVSDSGPAAIDKAFRIFQLPQGIFAVAITTVIFPTLARFAARGATDDLRATMANGMRQIVFVLLPAAAAVLVLSEPMVRLVYQHGEFNSSQTQLVSTALFWYGFLLPTNGVYLLLTRTFFSMQRPWLATAIAGVDLSLNAIGSLALYGPFGIGGIVASTAATTLVVVAIQIRILGRELGGLEMPRFAASTLRMAIAAAALAAVSWGIWDLLDGALGRSVSAQIVSLSVALAAGLAIYLAAARALRIGELDQILRLLRRR